MKSKVLILGAGFAGATCAHLLKDKYDVTVVEGAPFAGGGCRTHIYAGHPYTFGPRIFFSMDDTVINTLTSLVDIREFDTLSLSYVQQDSEFYDYPLQWHDVERMPDSEIINKEISNCQSSELSVENFEEYWLSAIGPTMYKKFVDEYSKKMWGIKSNKALSANFEWVNRGTPIRDGDRRLYTDQFQGYPKAADGYNQFFDKALAEVNVNFNTKVLSFDPEKMEVNTTKGTLKSDIVINTLPVDSLFKMTYGELQYVGRKLLKIALPIEYALPEDVTWIHYSGDEPHTRVTEIKKITLHKSPHTLLLVEIPDEGSRYYPIQSKPELLKFSQYQEMFPKNFFSIGRHGSFKYKGIPDAIRDALDIEKSL